MPNVDYAKYDQTPWTAIGTTLTSSGTVLAAPAAGTRNILDYLTYYMVDGSTAGTVTLVLGAVTLPPVVLGSSRGSFSLPAYTLGTAEAITATLGGSGSVAFVGRYVTANG